MANIKQTKLSSALSLNDTQLKELKAELESIEIQLSGDEPDEKQIETVLKQLTNIHEGLVKYSLIPFIDFYLAEADARAKDEEQKDQQQCHLFEKFISIIFNAKDKANRHSYKVTGKGNAMNNDNKSDFGADVVSFADGVLISCKYGASHRGKMPLFLREAAFSIKYYDEVLRAEDNTTFDISKPIDTFYIAWNDPTNKSTKEDEKNTDWPIYMEKYKEWWGWNVEILYRDDILEYLKDPKVCKALWSEWWDIAENSTPVLQFGVDEQYKEMMDLFERHEALQTKCKQREKELDKQAIQKMIDNGDIEVV